MRKHSQEQNLIREWIMDYFDRDKTAIRDCAQSGARNGSCGLIYTRDITAFYKNYSADVWSSLEDFADVTGENFAQFMADIFLNEDHRGTSIRTHEDFVTVAVWAAVEYEAQNIIDYDLIPSENNETDDDEE